MTNNDDPDVLVTPEEGRVFESLYFKTYSNELERANNLNTLFEFMLTCTLIKFKKARAHFLNMFSELSSHENIDVFAESALKLYKKFAEIDGVDLDTLPGVLVYLSKI